MPAPLPKHKYFSVFCAAQDMLSNPWAMLTAMVPSCTGVDDAYLVPCAASTGLMSIVGSPAAADAVCFIHHASRHTMLSMPHEPHKAAGNNCLGSNCTHMVAMQVLHDIGEKHGVSASCVAGRWVLQQHGVSAIVLGARNATHLRVSGCDKPGPCVGGAVASWNENIVVKMQQMQLIYL